MQKTPSQNLSLSGRKFAHNFLGGFLGTFLSKCKYFEDQSTKCRDFLYLGVLRGIRMRKNFGEISDTRGYPDIADISYNTAQKSYFELIFDI